VIRGDKWKAYKARERRFNEIAERHDRAIGGLKIPGTGLTIDQRNAAMKPTIPNPFKEAANKPFSKRNRAAKNIKDDRSLDALLKQMDGRLGPNYFAKQVKMGRDQARKMFEMMNDHEIIARMNKLSDVQFDVFWNEAGVADKVGNMYHFFKLAAAGSSNDARIHQQYEDDHRPDIEELLDWAGELNDIDADSYRGISQTLKRERKARKS
jgi:hypothetical protein